MIIVDENLFLIILGIVWVVGAILQDLHRREVDNIWNFSLIGFALAYRLAVSVYGGNYWFIFNGLIGFGIFLLLGNLFYYSRLFAGGDAKLLIALGTILPFSFDWIINMRIFGVYIVGFLLGGSLYVFVWSLVLVVINWKRFSKEFVKQARKKKRLFLVSFVFVIFWIFSSYFISLRLVYLVFVFLMFPFLFVFAKAVEESCMIKSLKPNKITVGDWLYEDIYVNRKKIKANWEGVSKKELELIKRKYRRNILVKQGIPFTPSFLIGFVVLLWFDSLGWF